MQFIGKMLLALVLCVGMLALRVPESAITLHAQTRTTAQTGRPPTVAATSHGIRISLSISQQEYPRNALARFTVTVKNVSHANRYLQDFQPDRGGPYSPHILMRTSTGRLIYEEDLSAFLAPSPGDLGGNYVLHPGDTLTRPIRFVLEASQVQAVTRVADGYTAFSSRPGTPTPPRSAWAAHLWHISSPWVHLTLINEAAPTVIVSRTKQRIHVTVRPPWSTTGSMFYMDSARCWTGPGTMSINQHVPWMRARNNTFSSSLYGHCPSKQPWRVVAGWPNRPVAFVSSADAATIK